MSDESRRQLSALYDDDVDHAALLDASLEPLGPDVLFALAGELGAAPSRRRPCRQLLRVARMRRDPQRYLDALGDDGYAMELADSLYGVYQLLGKLSASIDVLRTPS